MAEQHDKKLEPEYPQDVLEDESEWHDHVIEKHIKKENPELHDAMKKLSELVEKKKKR